MIYSKEIEKRISKIAKGQLFGIFDFLDIANYELIRKTLERLTKSGKIERVFRGIYQVPCVDSNGILIKATPYAVAYEMARQKGWLVGLFGVHASNYFDLSHEVCQDVVLVSDGLNRHYAYDGVNIIFKHIAQKDIQGLSTITITLVQAIKVMKQPYFKQEQIKALASQLSEEEKTILLGESDVVTKWVGRIIKDICKY